MNKIKELQITIKCVDQKDFEEAIKFALYEISLGVKDNDINLINEDTKKNTHLKYRIFEDY